MSEPDLVPLADFDPPVARAVVTVLQRDGIPAEIAQAGLGEATVLVASEHRAAAVGVLARDMEAVRNLSGPGLASAGGGVIDDLDDEPATRPLVMERLRRLGFVSVALAPLLVVTLSNVRFPLAYAIAVFVGGAALVAAWRTGRFGGGSSSGSLR